MKKYKFYENKNGSCVLVGYDNNEQTKYDSVRCTNNTDKSFRCDVKNLDKAYSFCRSGINDTV